MTAQVLALPARRGRPSNADLSRRVERLTAIANELRFRMRVRDSEESAFAARVERDLTRVARLLEAELVLEAHQIAGTLAELAARRSRQLEADR